MKNDDKLNSGFINFIFSKIEAYGYISQEKIRKYIKSNNLSRNESFKIIDGLIKEKKIKKDKKLNKGSIGKKKVIYVKNNEKICSFCNDSNIWCLFCQYCGRYTCKNCFYNYKNRIICKDCIKQVKFCSSCIDLALKDIIIDDIIFDLTDVILQSTFNIGVLVKFNDDYFCDNEGCQFHLQKIDQLDQLLELDKLEDKLNFFNYGSIETNVYLEDIIPLLIMCNSCSKLLKVNLEKTEPEIVEDRESGMGPEYDYNKQYLDSCPNCGQSHEITFNYSYYASEEDLIDYFIFNDAEGKL